MGREIRMVPANWDHPVVVRGNGRDGFQPMFDRRFEDAAAEWKKEFANWESGERPEYCDDESKSLEYWEWNGDPPDRKYYRPWKDDDATWYQVWETVSEGTPVSPPFATKEELIEYLVANGDYWDQARRKDGLTSINCDPWPRKQAEAFVNGPGWAPSMVFTTGKGMQSGVQALADMETEQYSGNV